MTLEFAIAKRPVDIAARAYLHETLGFTPEIRAWPGVGQLPYFLLDAFDVRELKLLNRQVLLAIEKRTAKPGLVIVRGQIAKMREIAGVPVVYVTAALASYERKRLIEQKVPFLVPGNQLYLPDLGIDLREYFRTPPVVQDTALAPATQAMLIAILLRQPLSADWQPAKVVADLGYTSMTLSRAVKEITASGIATLRTVGRARWLHTERDAAETWDRAKPLMRSPVKRRFWAKPIPKWNPALVRLAGQSALAQYSMLTEPQWPIYAISQAQWKKATQAGIEELPEPQTGAWEWELWHYSPTIIPGSESVDPLSLTLSLQANPDERIQLAIEELKGRFPW